MFSKVIIVLTLTFITIDAILHPHSGDAKNPNKHLRPEEYKIELFRPDDFQAMIGMSFMVFDGVS